MKKLYIGSNKDIIFIASNSSINIKNFTHNKYDNQRSRWWSENHRPISYYKKNIIRNIYYSYSMQKQKLLIILNTQSFEICKELFHQP